SDLDCRLRLRVRREPQRAGGPGRIEPEFLPPSGFIAVTMQLAMMSPTERYREFVADLATEGRVCAKRRWCGSEGRRPQTRHGWFIMCRMWSRSRRRRGSGKVSTPFSIFDPLLPAGRHSPA